MTYRHFISTVMAAAIALTALSSAPARANHNTARIIAGAAALTIIGVGIAAATAHNDRDVYVTHRVYRPRPVTRNVHVYHHYRSCRRPVYRHYRHRYYCR